MKLRLEHLASCFQGLIPATLFTCSAEGEPNVAYLSHVEYVDPRHVALSFQFFNKSRKNVERNPFALVRVIDPDSQRGYDLRLRFARSESEGPLFESMRLRIEAIASFTGLKGIFRLRAADVYEVLEISPAPEEPGEARRTKPEAPARFSLAALQQLVETLDQSKTLDDLVDGVLNDFERLFALRHSVFLLRGEQEGRLVAVATRGYGNRGVGAEVGHGEGIIGMAAEARAPIRISGMLRQMLYAAAVREENLKLGHDAMRRVPLPGLETPQSQLAIPLVAGGELLGVIFAESEEPYRFHEQDKACISVLGSYVALALNSLLLKARLEEIGCSSQSTHRNLRILAAEPAEGGVANACRMQHELSFFRSEECILVDGEYLVRSLPAKILWRLLEARAIDGRTEFTNRELRLDKSLALPAYKDNLETRLLLLRRRLTERCPYIRLVPRSRGHFRLELDCELELVEHD